MFVGQNISQNIQSSFLKIILTILHFIPSKYPSCMHVLLIVDQVHSYYNPRIGTTTIINDMYSCDLKRDW